jgi:hypothetical protein
LVEDVRKTSPSSKGKEREVRRVRDDAVHEAPNSWVGPDGSDWSLTFLLKKINGRTECIGMEIRSFADREPLTSKTMRALPFGKELDRAVQAELGRNERLMNLAARLGGRVPELETQNAALTQRGKPRQRASYKGGFYEHVAETYRVLCSEGSKAPTRDTAKALGLRYSQAAKIIQRCRSSEPPLLPPTRRGIGGVALDSAEEAE